MILREPEVCDWSLVVDFVKEFGDAVEIAFPVATPVSSVKDISTFNKWKYDIANTNKAMRLGDIVTLLAFDTVKEEHTVTKPKRKLDGNGTLQPYHEYISKQYLVGIVTVRLKADTVLANECGCIKMRVRPTWQYEDTYMSIIDAAIEWALCHGLTARSIPVVCSELDDYVTLRPALEACGAVLESAERNTPKVKSEGEERSKELKIWRYRIGLWRGASCPMKYMKGD